MNAKTRKIFAGTLIEVLEQFGYMLGDEARQEDCIRACSGALMVTMTYSGPSGGTVTLLLSTALARTIAANVLGADRAALKASDAEDTARELLNVFTGKLCHELYGKKVVIDLTVPVLRRCSKKKCTGFCKHPDAVHLAVEGVSISGRLETK